MRRTAREMVFKLVFEYTFYDAQNEGTLEFMLQDSALTTDDKEFISNSYNGVVEKFSSLRERLSKNIDNYTIERLYRPDLVVLIMALYEIEDNNTPVPVIINEAVGLAKKYGTDKSGKFVNGVLAKFAK